MLYLKVSNTPHKIPVVTDAIFEGVKHNFEIRPPKHYFTTLWLKMVLLFQKFCLFVLLLFCLMVFNATFNNISAIYRGGQFYWCKKPENPEKNHWPVASHWQTLSHNVVHLALIEIRTHAISGDRHWLRK